MITIYTATDINKLSQPQLFNEMWLDDLFDSPDEITRERILAQAELRAKELGCHSQFKKLVSAYRKELKRLESENAKATAVKHIAIRFETNEYGKPLATINNFLQVFRNDERFATVRYNTLKRSPEKTVDGKIVRWTDADDAATREYIERRYRFHSTPKCDDALRILFAEREYNPAIDLIDSFEWDGIPRITTMLTKWLGAEDTPYSREVSRLIFAGGIHRLYDPGCKFDDVPILIGTKQGEGKSTFIRWLALSDDFFTEVNEIEGQKGMEAVEGAWICEMGELLALTRAKDVEAVKSFITRQVDHYRRPYDRRTSDYKRQCIFIGTTNKQQFLTDRTGNRRFYPVQVNQTGYELFNNAEAIKADIRQCWAEAKALYIKGELQPYANRTLMDEIRKIQNDAVEDDYRVGMIEDYLDGRTEVCVMELWKNALRNEFAKPSKKDSNEIGLIMQNMESWTKLPKAKRTAEFGVQKCWVREGEIDENYGLLP